MTPDKRLRVVVVSHDATLTGAPMSLLRIWRAAVAGRSADVAFIVLEGGQLLPDFERTAKTLTYRSGFPRRITESPFVKRALQRRFLSRALRTLQPFDAVVVNTGTLGYLMPTARAAGKPVVTHVHEMRQWLTTRVSPADLQQTAALSDAVIACSESTRRDLLALGFDERRVTVVHEPLPPTAAASRDARAKIRQRLGVADDAVIVAGAGTADRRKGADLFVALGVALRALSDRPLYLPWFGHVLEADRQWLDQDGLLASSGVSFVGPVSDLAAVMQGVDVFCLTSREDPFPLVMLEAAAAGVPIVAFQGTGGADELLAGGVGLLASHLDVGDMARAVAGLLSDRSAAAAMGERGRAATVAFAPERIAAQVLKVVTEVATPEAHG